MKKLLITFCILIAPMWVCKSQSKVITPESKHVVFIIDGKLVQKNQVNRLTENDIVEMIILKGKASKALYGRRGKDASVLITTKKAGIRIYHRNLSSVSKDYSGLIQTVGNEDSLLYVINDKPILEYYESVLYKLDPRQISELKIIGPLETFNNFGIRRREGAVVIKTK